MISVSAWTFHGSAAQAPRIETVRVIESGVYRAETVKRTNTPGTTGIVNTVENIQLITNTTNILGQIGVRFGLRYIPIGSPSGAAAGLNLAVTFPRQGLRKPNTGETLYRIEHVVSAEIGATMYRDYAFENDWEIVAGLWIFEFWSENRKLGEQRFCVYDLRSSRHPVDRMMDCPPAFLDQERLLHRR